MTLTMEINDLSNKELANQFVDDMADGLITVKQLVRKFKIQPKYAHYILKTHSNTLLAKPNEFSSHKYINYNLYKKVSDEKLSKICDNEIESLSKIKTNIKAFVNTGFNQHLYKKYRFKPSVDMINI